MTAPFVTHRQNPFFSLSETFIIYKIGCFIGKKVTNKQRNTQTNSNYINIDEAEIFLTLQLEEDAYVYAYVMDWETFDRGMVVEHKNFEM